MHIGRGPGRTATLIALAGCLIAGGIARAGETSASAVAPTDELEAFRSALEEELARSPLREARVGVHVVSLDTGRVLFAHDADQLLNPASNVKLVTSAAALARLGPEYRFTTEFTCSERLVRGYCPVLHIRGRGDPSLYTERVYGIASELFHRGLRRVGDIVVDDTWFDDQREGPGWEQENTANSDRAYMAPAGALSVNHNTIAIYVSPGPARGRKARVELEPHSDYFVVDNQVTTVGSRSRGRLVPSSIPAKNRQRVIVRGRLPLGRRTASFYRKIDNPPMYAGETFKAVFRQRGIDVRGRVRLGVVPEGAVELYTSYSEMLADVIRTLNKYSNNFVAEQLLKTLGAEVKGPPGTWSKGVDAVEEYLAEIGIPKGSFVMRNGSGLNDVNRFSASQLTRLLSAIERESWFFPEYAASLGIAGRDGTLRSRMEETIAAGRLRGKTGTLENVTALSGYVRAASGERFAYSIMVNDFTTRHGPAIRAVDRLGEVIARAGRPAMKPSPEPGGDMVATTTELKARVATFAQLSRAADARNLAFLRSALRTEQDPVLRAVIADAIWRADAEAGLPWLLENVPTNAETYSKLRSVGQELSLPTPGVSSLIDVAAEGHPEALDKLLSLVYATREDATGAKTFAEGLQEVGRTAPDELYDALERASDEISTVALTILGEGIAATEERVAHPFMDRLKTPGEDGAPVPAAMVLYERIVEVLDKVTEKAAEVAAAPENEEPVPPSRPAPSPSSVTLPGGG